MMIASYYIVVVFIDPLQGLYAILSGDTVDCLVFFLPLDGYGKAPHKSLQKKPSFRKTKTDKADARTIAMTLISDVNLKSCSDISYHNEELKSLTRYRFDKAQERAQLKQSVSRLVTILFPAYQG